MRIMYVADALDRSEEHIVRGVARAGHSVRALLPDTLTAVTGMREAGVEAVPFQPRGRMDLRAVRRIYREIASYEPDVVHCLRENRPLANLLWATRLRPTPTVCYRGTLGNLSWWNPGSRLTYLSRRVDRVVAVSEGVRRYLLDLGLPAERVVTIYKGHDVAWYECSERPDLAEFGISAGAFVVGCVANMRALKGVDFLVRALDHLTTRREVRLLLVGEVRDPKLAELIEQPAYARRVHAIGPRQDANAIAGACHICCMPSVRREGLPRAVIESMSQGLPAVVTAIGGMVELVEDGVSGRVVPAGDAAALGEAISFFAENEAARVEQGRAAKKRIETVFSIDRTVDRTLGLYLDLVGVAQK